MPRNQADGHHPAPSEVDATTTPELISLMLSSAVLLEQSARLATARHRDVAQLPVPDVQRFARYFRLVAHRLHHARTRGTDV